MLPIAVPNIVSAVEPICDKQVTMRVSNMSGRGPMNENPVVQLDSL
jgi:hypothetical protein